MTVYFVSRHPGALAWAGAQGIVVDVRLEHLELEQIEAGDWVIGSLPVNMAAKICDLGGRYFHLSLEVPQRWRGKELSLQEMTACGARLEEYRISKNFEGEAH
ncbi:MAG: CRISPR-associated protein Csx16 [Magnetococcales bacterium]|nr:CRISPR-associated protein Csx16 [Magnetococcales bacterium]